MFVNMRRSQKTKRVSWASEVNLCQERLFSSKESPSQVVLGTQDHLHAGKFESLGKLPPGFGQTQLANPWTDRNTRKPMMKWRCPLRFEVNIDWEVVAGEESKEVAAQRQREMRVLEAIYPRPSSIPPNPSVLGNVGDSIAKDENIPVVPITPIEDDDDTPLTANPNPMTEQPQISQASVLANRNLADRDLLIKILSDPKMVKQLTSSLRAQNMPSNEMPKQTGPFNEMPKQTGPFNEMPKTNIQFKEMPKTNIPFNEIPKQTSQSAQNKPPNGTQLKFPSLRPPTNNAQITMATQTGSFYPTPQNRNGPVPCSRPGAPVKDMNYFKSLIQQHGIERQDGLPSQEQHLNVVKSKPAKKMMKRCMYFNSPKGCRKGADCTYQHVGSALNGVNGFPEVYNPKRIKLDGGIAGR